MLVIVVVMPVKSTRKYFLHVDSVLSFSPQAFLKNMKVFKMIDLTRHSHFLHLVDNKKTVIFEWPDLLKLANLLETLGSLTCSTSDGRFHLYLITATWI